MEKPDLCNALTGVKARCHRQVEVPREGATWVKGVIDSSDERGLRDRSEREGLRPRIQVNTERDSIEGVKAL